MKILEKLKREDGAVLPLVTILLAFVLIGFVGLVIDVGMLYGVRRNMVTAADAAALAAADVMLDDGTKAEAEKVAKDIAVANGVDNVEDITVSWVNSDWDYMDINTITVTVKNNTELSFMKIFGYNDTDVAAKAVATWGYVTKIEGGNIIPVFAKYTDYVADITTYLHSDKFVSDTGDVVDGNWGLLDIFGSTSGINDAFSGENMDARLEIDYTIDNQTGLNIGSVTGIEERMQTANTLADQEDRVEYMCGLVPIIDWDNITQQGSSLKLPILSFAVFEIQDVIMAEGNNVNKRSKGSTYALYDTATYTSDGAAVEYPQMDTDGDGELEDLAKGTIVGRFTGVTVEVRAVVQAGDKENPDPTIETPKYSKLIE